jgi:hypothetical protein
LQIAPRRKLPAHLAGGLALGAALWFFAGPIYNPLVTSAANWTIQRFEETRVTQLIWSEGGAVVNRLDFPPSSPRPLLAVGDLTFNIILLTVLFALAARPLSDRNVGRYVAAALALFPIHVFALIASVESIYALRLGPWSVVHYGAWARNFWGTTSHFYEVVGVHAVPFVLWLLFSSIGKPDDDAPKAAKRKR